MNISEHSGESSCKRQENGDKSSDTDRPLKKARFAWQVKGKYHLKAERNDEIHYSSVDSAPEDATFLGSSDSEIETGSLREQNLEILGDYLLKQDFNTLDTVADSEIKKEDELKENLPYQRYLTIPCHVYDNNIHNCSSSSNDENLPIHMSMVYKTSWLEDRYINRWQTMQMTKSFVDNSINRVLDTWLTTALPTEESDNRTLALDVAEFVNNLPGDNTVENEGILMAISAHGLQNNSNSSVTTESNLDSIEINQSSPNSPIEVDDNNSDKTEKDRENNLWDMNKMCLCSDSVAANENKPTPDQKTESILSSTSSLQSGDSSSSGRQDDSLDMDKYYQQYENVSSYYGDDLYADQFDFMDAAVSFAIQNKGLTSYGTDYG